MALISAIMTAHREGLLAGPSIGSFRAAAEVAQLHGLDVEKIVVLDRPDPITIAIFEHRSRTLIE
jgi:hypothetical protein